MTLGVLTQIAMVERDDALRKLNIATKRLVVIKIMMNQFAQQAQALPVTDPARQVIEMFIDAVNKAADGVVAPDEEKRIVVVDSSGQVQ